ncbi:MAG: response regulator [Methanosarcinales archaeon]|nr:response regulator [Methanosarcinales archaeon]
MGTVISLTNPGESARRLKVMLVEDNPEDVFLTRKVLRHRQLDQDLMVAEDGLQALEALKKLAEEGSRLPDLILLDINLPVMGGLEFLQMLKDDSRFTPIPVVILTGSNINGDIQRSYDLGARTYLVKPIRIQDLALAVNDLFPEN